MDMKLIYKLLVVLLGVSFWTCEQPLDINIDRADPQIIVQSNFSENHVLQVVVQKTEEFSSNFFTTIITNAVVQVYDGETFIETLELIQVLDDESIPPYYQSVFFTPSVGIAYTIKVEVPGFESIFATSAIPMGANLGDVSFNNQTESIEGGLESISFEVGMGFDDPKGIANYYHILFIQEVTAYQINLQGDTILENTTIIDPQNLQIDPINGDITMIKFTDNRSFLINDEFFDGQQISIPFKGKFIYDPNKFILKPFKVEFRTVTRDYYLYHTSFAKNSQSGSDPFSGPVVIHNNVKGGSGLFSGYDTTITEFDITN
jgi:hypothetical protein